jgi:hypothetical protein
MDCSRCGQTLIKNETKCWQCGFDNARVIQEANASSGQAGSQASQRPGRPFQPNFFGRVQAVLTFNIGVFDDIAKRKPWNEIAVLVVVSTLLSVMVNSVYVYANPTDELMKLPQDTFVASVLISFVGGGFLALIFTPMMLLLMSSILHLSVRLFGGREKWSATTAIFTYLQVWTPLSLALGGTLMVLGHVAAAVIVNIVFFVATMAELALAIGRVHRLSGAKAALAVLFPIVLLLMAAAVLAFLLGIGVGLMVMGG